MWVEQIKRLLDNWPREQPPTDTLELYEQELAYISNERFESIVDTLLRTEVYFPNLSKFFAALETIQQRDRAQPSRDVRSLPAPSEKAPPVKGEQEATDEHGIVLIGGIRHQLTDNGPAPILDTREEQRAYIKAKCGESFIFNRDWEQSLSGSPEAKAGSVERQRYQEDLTKKAEEYAALWDKPKKRQKVYKDAREMLEELQPEAALLTR